MKKYLTAGLLLSLAFLLSSCLKRGLDDLPAFTDANIDRFDFEYRWDDNGTFRVVRFNTSTPVVDGKSVSVTTTVPPASGSFTAAVRAQVLATGIVGMCNVSTAATIKPVDGSPALGVPADFSKTATYQVTAADGKTVNVWTLHLSFVK